MTNLNFLCVLVDHLGEEFLYASEEVLGSRERRLNEISLREGMGQAGGSGPIVAK